MNLDLFYDLKKQSPTQVVWFWMRSMLKNIPEMVLKIIQGAIWISQRLNYLFDVG